MDEENPFIPSVFDAEKHRRAIRDGEIFKWALVTFFVGACLYMLYDGLFH